MPHLLHIDSSVLGEHSTSRALTARAAERWLEANPGGTVTYRDLDADPVPHLNSTVVGARNTPEADRTPEQQSAFAIGADIVAEVAAADVVLLGLPLYNYGAPSTVKAWVDHLLVPGLAYDAATSEPFFADTPLVVLVARGGGYGEGTPRFGWDHAAPWLPHGLSLAGLQPEFIEAELRLSYVVPAMQELIPLAETSLAAAHAAIDARFAPVPA